MKKILVLLVCFFLTFAGINIYSGTTQKNTTCVTIDPPASFAYCIRMHILDVWWTFYYETDGSLIVAIPDDDE